MRVVTPEELAIKIKDPSSLPTKDQYGCDMTSSEDRMIIWISEVRGAENGVIISDRTQVIVESQLIRDKHPGCSYTDSYTVLETLTSRDIYDVCQLAYETKLEAEEE